MVRLLLLLLLGFMLLPPTAHAAQQQVVVITANPGGNITCIDDFTVTIASSYEIQLAWTPATAGNTTGTMIRGAFDRWPTSPTDGFEVYNDEGNSTSHWLSTDVMILSNEGIYYRAWTKLGVGNYTVCYASGSVTGGEAVEEIASNIGLFAFVFFALVGTVATYAIRRTALAFITAGAWAVLAFYCYTLSASTSPIEITDIYMALFWIGIAMVAVSAFEPAVMRTKEESELPPVKEPGEEEDLTEQYSQLRKEMGAGLYKNRPRRRERKLE